eukprot:symbB.v1.2.037769.t1/scaffold5666.1/size24764/2
MGRERGQLPAQPAVLKAALADARAAVSLSQRLGVENGKLVLKAVRTLQEALVTTGENIQEARDVAGQASQRTFSEEVIRELQQLAQGIDTKKLCEEMDADVNEQESPGTFRWPRRMPLPRLPVGCPDVSGLSEKGWGPYLKQRGGDKMIAAARSNAMMLDALSFPLSLAWILLQDDVVTLPTVGGHAHGSGSLHVVVLGATSKAEVRILQESDYWQELVMLLKPRCHIQLHFVGPVSQLSENGRVGNVCTGDSYCFGIVMVLEYPK